MDQGERKELPHACLVAFERDQKGKLCGAQFTQLTENGKLSLDAAGQNLKEIQYGAVTKSLQDHVKPALEPNLNKSYTPRTSNYLINGLKIVVNSVNHSMSDLRPADEKIIKSFFEFGDRLKDTVIACIFIHNRNYSPPIFGIQKTLKFD